MESHVVASWPRDPQQTYSQPGSFTSEVDENGSFDLRVPKDSPLDIHVVREGSSLASQEQVLWESLRDEDLAFAVPPPEKVAINGRVVDADGNPVSGVAIRVQRVYSDAVNSFSIWSVYTGETDAEGRYQTPAEFPRQAAYHVELAEAEAERWQAKAAGISDRDDEMISMEDLRVEPATAIQAVVESPASSKPPQSPVSLTIIVKDAGGAPAEAARVVVWSAGKRTRLQTDAEGQTELSVKSAAWVIAGGVEGLDYTGAFVEDPSQPVELRLPLLGEATPRSFGPRPLAEPLKARLVTSLEQFTRRALDEGNDYQRQEALRTLAGTAPELALEMARELAPDITGWPRYHLERLAALRLADDAPQRATEVAAEIEDGRFRALAQAELLRRLPESMAEQQAAAAIDSARSISDPGIRLEALIVVAKQLDESGREERVDQLVREALPLVPEADADERADYRRGMLAVQLGRRDLAAAERLLPEDDGASQESHAFYETRAELAEQLLERDPDAAERFVRQLNRRYRDEHLPRLVYQMAHFDLPRAERWAAMMSGPGGKTFAQAAIAAALVEHDPAEARRRFLEALDRLESLSDRAWRTGEDDYQLVKVGVTLLPWIAQVAPERTGDSFWRVLALRDAWSHGIVESRLGPYEPDGGMRTSDPVLAAFVSHFDADLARLLLMPPDDTRLTRPQMTPPFFFGGLAAVDPAAALNAIDRFSQGTPDEIKTPLEAWEELAAILSRDGMERWQWLQRSQYGLEFVDGSN